MFFYYMCMSCTSAASENAVVNNVRHLEHKNGDVGINHDTVHRRKQWHATHNVCFLEQLCDNNNKFPAKR